jgi:hypothetical protein
VFAVIATLFIVGAAAAGLMYMGYRYLKGRGVLGGAGSQQAAMVPANQPAKPALDSAHPVVPANVELSNPRVSPTALDGQESSGGPTQGANAQQASQQPSASAVTVKAAAQEPPAKMTINGSRAQGLSTPVKIARAERLQVESSPASVPSGHPSRVAVSVQGEAGLNASVARIVTRELESEGLRVVLTNDLPSTEAMGSQPSTSALIEHLRGQAGVLIVARIEPTGERELHYYGRTDTSYGSRVTLTAYDVASAQPIGTRQSASLEYTHLNADDSADEAVTPLARKIARAIGSR